LLQTRTSRYENGKLVDNDDHIKLIHGEDTVAEVAREYGFLNDEKDEAKEKRKHVVFAYDRRNDKSLTYYVVGCDVIEATHKIYQNNEDVKIVGALNMSHLQQLHDDLKSLHIENFDF